MTLNIPLNRQTGHADIICPSTVEQSMTINTVLQSSWMDIGYIENFLLKLMSPNL